MKKKTELKPRSDGWSKSFLDDLLNEITTPTSQRKIYMFINKEFLMRLTDEKFISFIEDDNITKEGGLDCYRYIKERYNKLKPK
jgi:hypothetical protein